MNDYNKNLKRLELLKDFKGGDNEDVPLHPSALNDMKYIIDKCKEFNLPQPIIFPWAGGDGIQAEWRYDWHLTIDSSSRNGIAILFIKEKNYDDAIILLDLNIEKAFELVKTFLIHIVNLNKE